MAFQGSAAVHTFCNMEDMMSLKGKKVAILVEDMFNMYEFWYHHNIYLAYFDSSILTHTL